MIQRVVEMLQKDTHETTRTCPDSPQRLEELLLQGNDIQAKACCHLIQVLTKSSALDVLHIRSLNLSHNEVGQDGILALSELLVNPGCVLVHLALAANRLRDGQLRPLLHALTRHHSSGKASKTRRSCTSLRTLDLSENELQDAPGMARMIQNNACLTKLDLHWNHYRGSAIPMSFRQNYMIEELDLGFNALEMAGFAAFAKALEENHTLVKLNLAFNRISSSHGGSSRTVDEKALWAHEVMPRLMKCDTLLQLNVSGNALSGPDVQELRWRCSNIPEIVFETVTRDQVSPLPESTSSTKDQPHELIRKALDPPAERMVLRKR